MRMRSTAGVAGLVLGLMSGTASAAPITFNYTGEFQTYNIGTSGIYNVAAFGAQGGSDTPAAGNGSTSGIGGLGAEIGGQFTLSKGQTISIAVGGQGTSRLGTPYAGAGGGGTFIVFANGTPLLIAGGGGGASYFGEAKPGSTSKDGTVGGSDGDPDAGGAGGVNGLGGGAGTSYGFINRAGGGGGFLSDGQGGGDRGGQGGRSYAGGLQGGQGISNGSMGGFGGGGGTDNNSGGGGGGYSGGGGASYGGGGGGGSYLDMTSLVSGTEFALDGVRTGDGFASIEFISALPSVPLPGSAPLFGAALLALGAVGYGVKRKKAAAAA